MAGHQLVGGTGVVVFVVAFRQHVFLLRFQHGKAAYFFKVSIEAAFAGGHGR